MRLIEEYRTTLTGLTPEETRALFMMSIPAPLLQLGMGEKFKGALLKLSASLPDTRRADEARTRQRIHLDSSWWFQSEQEIPCLQAIEQALWQDRHLRLKVRWEVFNTVFEQDAEPGSELTSTQRRSPSRRSAASSTLRCVASGSPNENAYSH